MRLTKRTTQQRLNTASESSASPSQPENVAIPHSEITMKLVSGPFKKLNGKWTFAPVGDDKCQVRFQVDYEFSSKATEFALGTFFKTLSKTMVENFRNEANSEIREYLRGLPPFYTV